VQLFAINSIDLYSSGLTLQAIFPWIRRWQCVLVDMSVAGTLAAWTVFSNGFNTFIADFLEFMLIWIAPWVAIYLIDYTLRRGRYESASLMQTDKGLYYRNGGVHWPGVIAQVIGMVAAASFLNASPTWTSPLTKATNGADASVFMGALFAGAIYYWLGRPTVRAEAERSSMDEVAVRRAGADRVGP
jgi:nucleobase:cation symporter-1, NCS1 family